MSIFKRLFQKDPQLDLSKGQEAYYQRKYQLAIKLFEKAYKRFDTLDDKIIALDNAGLSAEKAEMYVQASNYYYQVVDLKLHNDIDSKQVLQDIDRAIHMARMCEKPVISLNKLLFMKFLIYLSEKNFDQLDSLYNNLKIKQHDDYSNTINETWNLIHSHDTFSTKAVLPQIDLPEGFLTIKDKAEQVMQRCSLCNIVLTTETTPKAIQKGNEFIIVASITAHASISINSIKLKTGTRGRIVTTTLPELPLKLSTSENYSILFTLIPNLPGEWLLGPLKLFYSISSESGEYPGISDSIVLNVNEAPPALKLSMGSETIQEDLEYLVTVSVENIGKTILQDIKIVIEIPPEGLTIQEGTNEKYISSLAEGELFKFDIRVVFSLDETHFEGHVIKADAFIDKERRISKSSIRLGGKSS